MDFSSTAVDKMLDYVDFADTKSNPKRRDAYVTEWYFENKILPKIATCQTTTGWCYVESKSTGLNV